jgi:hypothetical protein
MTMRYDYFHYTDLDRRFYEERLKTRMPARFLDAHTHINLPEHIVDVPPERIADDWALQNGLHMTAEDAAYLLSHAVSRPAVGDHRVPVPGEGSAPR